MQGVDNKAKSLKMFCGKPQTTVINHHLTIFNSEFRPLCCSTFVYETFSPLFQTLADFSNLFLLSFSHNALGVAPLTSSSLLGLLCFNTEMKAAHFPIPEREVT